VIQGVGGEEKIKFVLSFTNSLAKTSLKMQLIILICYHF